MRVAPGLYALMVFLVACDGGGGGGSSGFSLTEDLAIRQALEREECTPFDRLAYCPSGEEFQGTNVFEPDQASGRVCDPESAEGVCRVSLSELRADVPEASVVALAARPAAGGTWRVGPARSLAQGNNLFTAYVDVAIPTAGPQDRVIVQVVVLVFDEPPAVPAEELVTLSASGATSVHLFRTAFELFVHRTESEAIRAAVEQQRCVDVDVFFSVCAAGATLASEPPERVEIEPRLSPAGELVCAATAEGLCTFDVLIRRSIAAEGTSYPFAHLAARLVQPDAGCWSLSGDEEPGVATGNEGVPVARVTVYVGELATFAVQFAVLLGNQPLEGTVATSLRVSEVAFVTPVILAAPLAGKEPPPFMPDPNCVLDIDF